MLAVAKARKSVVAPADVSTMVEKSHRRFFPWQCAVAWDSPQSACPTDSNCMLLTEDVDFSVLWIMSLGLF